MSTSSDHTGISSADLQARVSALKAIAVLDTPPEKGFDALTRLAASVCNAPIAILSLLDGNRVWFKSVHGIDATQIDIAGSFCSECANSKALLQIANAKADPRFSSNDLVTGPLGIQYYAGAPIFFDDTPIGTLCVLDYVPRELAEGVLLNLDDMATIAGVLLSARVEAFKSFSETKTTE